MLMSDPGYPCNEAFVRLVGGEPIRMPVDERAGYQPTVEIVKEDWTADTVGVILATPSNPTGALIQPAQLEAINDFVVERLGFVMMDEVATSSLAIDPELIVVNSFSKYFGMTGWRLGWCAVPDLLIEALERAAQNLYIAPSAVAQYAALAHIRVRDSACLRNVVRDFSDVMYEGLLDAGLGVPLKPEGACYLYANISSSGIDAETFSARLLEEYRVAVTPGTDFGSYRAQDYVRFAYTANEQDIRRGLEQVGQAVRRFQNEV